MRMQYLRRMTVPLVVAAGLSAATAGTAAADVPFAFLPGEQAFTQTGAGARIAGGHPDLNIAFELQSDPPGGSGKPAQAPRSVTVDLPAGLIGDPRAASETCAMEEVVANEKAETAGRCPHGAAVGVAVFRSTFPSGTTAPVYRRRLFRVVAGPNEAAAFATTLFSVPVRIAAEVIPSGGYRVRTTANSLTQTALLRRLEATFWGVPADHQAPVQTWGDPAADCDAIVLAGDRYCNSEFSTPDDPDGHPGVRFGGRLPGVPRRAFVTNPSVCGADLTMGLRLVPYGTVFSPIETTMSAGTLSGCEAQPFDPSIEVAPKIKQAGQPSGLTVGIDVPQSVDADDLGTAHVKDVSVTLPEGVAISPPSANGLDACSDAQLDLNGDSDPTCPERSKIGTVKIDTPVLEEPVSGTVHLGTQLSNDPMSGQMYRLFLVAKSRGVLIKLKGAVKADPQTGQLTTSFENNPQLPFSRMELKLEEGNRASLSLPKTCGTYEARARITSWSGKVKDVTSSFVVDEGCPSGAFAPKLSAGTANPLAGAFSPFNMTVTRTDAEQELSRLNLEMPSGLLAALGSVPLCGEAEANAGSCPEASRIGSTNVLVGSGGEPLPLGGKVFVTGPYKGAPFGLSVVVPAKVGPFDLGDVVVRGQLQVDANNAKATAVTDAFPTIVGGVPVRLRQVSVSLDRPGFTFNATSCAAQQVRAGFTAVGGATAAAAVNYQAQGCDQLSLNPRLGLQWTGKSEMRKGKHPGVRASLGDLAGQANLKQVKVTLPLTAALDPSNAKALCSVEQAAARSCPAESIVGRASASTPALHERVTGPVYFVKGIRHSATGRAIETLPKLWVPLSGQGVTVDLWANSDVDSKKRLVSTFVNVPDVPVRDFQLEIHGGQNGILKATNDVCGASKTTTIEYSGHSGGQTTRRVAFSAPDCGPQIMTATNSRNRTVGVRVGGIEAGSLTLTGKGLGKATRKVVRSDSALVRAVLTSSARRQLAGGKSIRTRLSVRFAPAKGKAITLRRTVTIKAVKAKGARR